MSESESQDKTEGVREYPEDRTAKVPELTEEEELRLRAETEKFVLSTGCRHSRNSLHLPAENIEEPEPDCDTGGYAVDEWRAVETACFPPGYRDICLSCVARWRGDR